jgi:uncharacterized protein involved in exopolysaccharide biosynthesis/Mrp family chromosome partitioning ATPase
LIRNSATQAEQTGSYFRDGGGDRSAAEITPLQAALNYKWFILLFAIALTAFAWLVLKQMPVRYSATASVMIDARKLQLTDAASMVRDPTPDLDRLRTFMEQLKSPAVARVVVDQLDLVHQPEYCVKTSTLERLTKQIDAIRGVPDTAAAPVCDVSRDDAVEHLLGNVSGSNDGRSYIIKVSAEASTAQLAAAIANTYSAAFVADQRRQLSDTTDQASAWLTSYLKSLRAQVLAADAAVEAYQSSNQLTPIRGETVTAQRLSELNTQLTEVTGDLVNKQAALRQMQSGSGQLSGSAPAVLASPTIQALVTRLADLTTTEAELRARFGENYPSVVATAQQINRLQQAIRTESGKVVGGLSAEVAALSARKTELTAAVQALQSDNGVQGTNNIRLQALQREADTDRKLYEQLETRLHEVDAERHMQWPESSVAVAARPPMFPSFPRTSMTLTGVFIVALGIGTGIAFALSMLARKFRDVNQVEGETGVRVLGLFPQPPRRALAKEMVLSRPGSLEAETVHFTLANLIRGRDAMRPNSGWVVMVTSALPGEGKSSLAAALGHAAVRLGMSAALLQGDVRSVAPRRPGKTEAGGPEMLEPLMSPNLQVSQSLSKTAVDRSYLHVVPLRSFLPQAQRLAGSAEIAAVIRNLQSQFEMVIIDTPPILAVPDALSLAPMVDDTVLVVDWRKTPRRSVMATVKVLMRANMEITGIVLSKVSLRQFARQSTSEGLYARAYKGHSMAAGD